MRTPTFPVLREVVGELSTGVHGILLPQLWKEPEETDQRTGPFPTLCLLCSHQSGSPIKVDVLLSRAALSKCPFPLARYIFRWLLLYLIQVQSLSHQWVRKLGSFLLESVVSHCVDIWYLILRFTVYIKKFLCPDSYVLCWKSMMTALCWWKSLLRGTKPDFKFWTTNLSN